MTRSVEKLPRDLSEGQRDCLRLVTQHFSSKEIARSLGISPHTVDQRLRRATAVLNATNRFEAARIFATMEGVVLFDRVRVGQPPYQSDVYQRSYLLSTSEKADPELPCDDALLPEGLAAMVLREAQASYHSSNEPRRGKQPNWTAILEGASDNQLSISSRLFIMMAIMVLGLMGFALLINLIEGLSRLN